jgi:hypothetical protein
MFALCGINLLDPNSDVGRCRFRPVRGIERAKDQKGVCSADVARVSLRMLRAASQEVYGVG